MVACDVTDPAALADVLVRAGDKASLRGVVHCAGVLDDAVIAELTPERLARVLRPKVDGAAHLHRLTAGLGLQMFLLVSSAAGVVGNAGQGNYAAANVFLDQLAYHRRARGLPAVSVSFGAWAAEGLAVGHADLARMARLGYRALTPDQGRDMVELCLRRGAPHLVAWALDLSRLRESVGRTALWRSLLPAAATAGRGGEAPAARLRSLPEADRADRVLALVRTEASRVLGLRSAEAVRPDQPLRELGMDSLTAVELRNRLGVRLGAHLPATLVFDHPTPARLARYLLVNELGATARDRPKADVRPAHAASPADESIAIVAMACRLPGGVNNPDDLWRLVADGRDAVHPFPAGRWDVDALYDPDPDAPGKSYAREGGFVDDIESLILASSVSPRRRPPRWTHSNDCCWRQPGRHWNAPGSCPQPSPAAPPACTSACSPAATWLVCAWTSSTGYVSTGSAQSVGFRPSRLCPRAHDPQSPSIRPARRPWSPPTSRRRPSGPASAT